MWILKAVGGIVLTIAAPFVLPVALKQVKYKKHLPSWAALWDTPDQELPGGLYEPKVKKIYDKYGWFWCSYYWLLRNPAHGYSKKFRFTPTIGSGIIVEGSTKLSDDMPYAEDTRGIAYYFIENPDGKSAWELYGVIGKSFGLRFRLGWKLQPWIQKHDAKQPYWFADDGTSTGNLVCHVSIRKLRVK